MNTDESLKLLEKYTGALKKQAGLKEEYEKAISSFSVPEEAPRINSGKIMGPFAGVSLIIATAIRIGLSSSLSYKDTAPVTVGLYAGCFVLSLLISYTIIFFINKDLRKKHTDLKNVAEIAKTGKTEEYLKKSERLRRSIADAECILPSACHGIGNARIVKNRLISGKAETLEEAVKGMTEKDWEIAYKASMRFYEKPDGEHFGAFALGEKTETVFPVSPKAKDPAGGGDISKWRMAFVSLTNGDVAGDRDYFETLADLEPYIIDRNEESVLVRGLTPEEFESLAGK